MVSTRSDLIYQDGRIYHLGLAWEELSPNLLFVGDPDRAHKVAARFERIDHEVRNREYVTLTGHFRGLPVTVMGTGIGTDNLEIALMEAYALLAFDPVTACRRPSAPPITAIRIGTSGGVRTDVEPGTLCVSSFALGLDSTGLYFDAPPADEATAALEVAAVEAIASATPAGRRFAGRLPVYAARATPAVVEALARFATLRNAPYVTGITVAAPGFYGASGRYIEGLTNTVPDIKGVLASVEAEGQRVTNFEMESSLLFHLGQALGIRTGTICPVIGAPGAQDRVVDYAPFVEMAIDVALDALVALS